jgi:hypothetical protein
MAANTQLSKASTNVQSADSAAEAAAHEVNILRAKLAECQESVQVQRKEAQELHDKYIAAEKDLRQQLQCTALAAKQQQYVNSVPKAVE